jgi:hypothetical protein
MSFLSSLPTDTANPAYDTAVLANLSQVQVVWVPLASNTPDGHNATFYVTADALKLEGVRFNVSARLQQRIADALGCLLLTAKLADLLWLQRGVTLLPSPQAITSSTKAMQQHSARVDALLQAGSPQGPIVQSVGKHWILDNDTLSHPGKACNYGWHFPGTSLGGSKWGAAVTPPLRLIQDRGWFHDEKHIDYSQTACLVSRACLVDGVKRDLADVLRDPQLAPLVSHQGPLRLLRQPGVSLDSCPVGTAPVGATRLLPMPLGGEVCRLPSLQPPTSTPPAQSAATWLLVGGILIAASATAWWLHKKRGA